MTVSIGKIMSTACLRLLSSLLLKEMRESGFCVGFSGEN